MRGRAPYPGTPLTADRHHSPGLEAAIRHLDGCSQSRAYHQITGRSCGHRTGHAGVVRHLTICQSAQIRPPRPPGLGPCVTPPSPNQRLLILVLRRGLFGRWLVCHRLRRRWRVLGRIRVVLGWLVLGGRWRRGIARRVGIFLRRLILGRRRRRRFLLGRPSGGCWGWGWRGV